MKKMLCLIGFLAAASGLFAQSYILPEFLDISSAENETMIAPIGWSRDGKVAFVTFERPESIPWQIVGIFIFNARTDSTEWIGDYGSWDYDASRKQAAGYETFTDYYNSADVQFVLRNAGIIQNPGVFQEFPFQHNNATYDVAVYETLKSGVGGTGEFPPYRFFEIVMSRRTRSGTGSGAQKVLTRRDFLQPNQWLYGVDVVGCLKSPFEDRVLVIYRRMEATPEGPYGVYSFTGGHLNARFNDPLDEVLFSGH